MKPAILLFAAFITGVITLSSSSSPEFKHMQGTWVMQSSGSSCSNNVLRIKMDEGMWTCKIDIPEQDIYDREVYNIITKSDSIYITLAEQGPFIKAALVNNVTLNGELLVDGKADKIQFVKH